MLLDLQRDNRDTAARAAQEAAQADTRGIPDEKSDVARDRGGGRNLSPSKPERGSEHGAAAVAARRKSDGVDAPCRRHSEAP